MATTSPSRCERILALIDECLDEVAATVDAREGARVTGGVGTDQEGGTAA
jgi:hypothetical protein